MLTSSKTSTTIFCAFSLFLVFFNPSYGNEVLNTETITDKIGAWIKVCNEDPEECAWVQLALNSEGKQVPGYFLLNVSAEYSVPYVNAPEGFGTVFFLEARNLLDTNFETGGILAENEVSGTGGSGTFVTPGQPFSIFGGAKFTW